MCFDQNCSLFVWTMSVFLKSIYDRPIQIHSFYLLLANSIKCNQSKILVNFLRLCCLLCSMSKYQVFISLLLVSELLDETHTAGASNTVNNYHSHASADYIHFNIRHHPLILSICLVAIHVLVECFRYYCEIYCYISCYWYQLQHYHQLYSSQQPLRSNLSDFQWLMFIFLFLYIS